ncbi:MAG: DUF512 domain-containing protein [bacterium]|nr:DUF512 domain-containing protein [bacterium]
MLRAGRHDLRPPQRRVLPADRAPLPPQDQYGDFAQLDNGIGLTRGLEQTWREALLERAAHGKLPTRPVTVMTGKLGELAFAQRLLPALDRPGLPAIELVGVENRFYGESVTVAGLLAGSEHPPAPWANCPPRPCAMSCCRRGCSTATASPSTASTSPPSPPTSPTASTSPTRKVSLTSGRRWPTSLRQQRLPFRGTRHLIV